MLDAYTVRKAVPRILLAVIGVNLSIHLCVALVDITNIVGRGLMQLISAPFDFGKFNLDEGASNVGGLLIVLGSLVLGAVKLLGAGAGSGGLLGVMLLLILGIMLIALSILFTIAIRQTLIMLLILFSPIAIACMVLPGTEKYFKQWWDLFIKTLLVYPIIAALFAISGVMATLSFQSTDSTSNIAASFQVITGLILIFLPLFMIPFAFKFSGGAIGSIISATNGMRGNMKSQAREDFRRAAQNPHSTLGRTNRRINEAELAARQRLSKAGYAAEGQSGMRNFARRRAGRLARFGTDPLDLRDSKRNAERGEMLKQLAGTGDDAMAYAAAGYSLAPGESDVHGNHNTSTTAQFFNSKGKGISEREYRDSHKAFGGAAGVAQVLAYQFGKAAEDKDYAAVEYAFSKHAQARELNQDEVYGSWASIAYPGKGQAASEWYQDPRVQADGSVSFTKANPSLYTPGTAQHKKAKEKMGDMLKDVHKTRSSYDYSRIRAQDWAGWESHQKDIETRHAAGDAITDSEWSNYAMISDIAKNATTKIGPQYSADGEISTQGVSADAAGHLRALVDNQKFIVQDAVDASGRIDADHRVIAQRAVGPPTQAGALPAVTIARANVSQPPKP